MARRKKPRTEKKSVLIGLEDKKSERLYFQKLVKDKGLSGEVVFVKHSGTDPKSVLRSVLSRKQAKCEKKWIVIDKDDNNREQIEGTFKDAKDSGVCVAISNECYELWILLHFTPVTAYHSRADIKKKLNFHFQKICKIDYDKASADVYGYILGKQGDALVNSKSLMLRHIRDNGKISPFEANPITTIHQLVGYLNGLQDDKVSDEIKYFPQDMMSCPLCATAT